MIRQKRWFAVAYMFCLTAFFSSIVIALTRLTSRRVEASRRLAFERAVLTVVGAAGDGLSGLEVHRRFAGLIDGPDAASGGAFTLKEGGRVTAYALPVSGRGFWAPIKAVIGIGADRRTITGIAFYEQNETPGLGAEIAKPAFTGQFAGKVISAVGDAIDIRPAGTPLGDNEVHAVTGATQTSNRVEKMINAALDEWRAGPAGGKSPR